MGTGRILATGVGLVLASAGMARGQASCTSSGPDIIVADLTGPTNYASAGGIEAFSLGPASCNIGDTWVDFFAITNRHPVFGQNLFKYHVVDGSGRLEQLGQSWLFHGYFALSTALCCGPTCVGTDGTHLGVHCSDTSTSSRAGTPSALGPKWQVNAATGVFAYPPANPSYSGTVARRLQARIAELEPSSAQVRYFVEGQYVAPDDTAAGNGGNNTSYRECSMNGAGTAWTMGLMGTTRREQAGIRAWGDVAAGVTSSDVVVPGDGLIIVAGAATDLGGGRWHYEYAVQNLASDRSGQSFSVPVAAGVSVTNLGFHDVDYHDGDGIGSVNFDGTDWGATVAGGTVTWATQTYAQNPSANALRWGTLYNFRFDADTGPRVGGGAATIGLFKPGSPGSVMTGMIVVPGEAACPCDFNRVGGLNSQDFFDFVGAFFAGSMSADFNGDGRVDSQDFFDFLGCFFSPPVGC